VKERLLFTEEEWNKSMPEVVQAMTEHLRPYCTLISQDRGDHAKPWGTGTYLRLRGSMFILTNEHVAAARSGGQRLIYQLHGSNDLFGITGNHVAKECPLDLAILPAQFGWDQSKHHAKAICVDQISIGHDPVPGELFTFYGFAGKRSGFHFGTLISRGTCSTSREVELPEDDRFNSRFHFGVDYLPDLATTVLGTEGLPSPPGLSGSAVWNTGFVEARIRGIAWSPDFARVTGVIWGWPSGLACLVATRAEFVRSFMLGFDKVADSGELGGRRGVAIPGTGPVVRFRASAGLLTEAVRLQVGADCKMKGGSASRWPPTPPAGLAANYGLIRTVQKLLMRLDDGANIVKAGMPAETVQLTMNPATTRFRAFVLDTFGALHLSELSLCGAPALDEPPNYLGSFVLNSIIHLRHNHPIGKLILMFGRRVEHAVREYRHGRQLLLAYVSRLPQTNNHFLHAMRARTHFEECIGSAYQVGALLMRVVELTAPPDR
jgi:hypothetical protein